MPGFEILPWVGLFGPANLPPAVVEQLQSEVQRLLGRADAAASLAPLSAEPFWAGSAEFTRLIQQDIPKWRTATAEAGIKPQ